MKGADWWWAVCEREGGAEIDSSNNHDIKVDSGILARQLAEAAACEWLGISTDFGNG